MEIQATFGGKDYRKYKTKKNSKQLSKKKGTQRSIHRRTGKMYLTFIDGNQLDQYYKKLLTEHRSEFFENMQTEEGKRIKNRQKQF